MVKETKPQAKRQERKKPRTIEEIINRRETYVFSKGTGTLKCKGKNQEITAASFGATKPGMKVRHYRIPFTEDQAREICAEFRHNFARK